MKFLACLAKTRSNVSCIQLIEPINLISNPFNFVLSTSPLLTPLKMLANNYAIFALCPTIPFPVRL